MTVIEIKPHRWGWKVPVLEALEPIAEIKLRGVKNVKVYKNWPPVMELVKF